MASSSAKSTLDQILHRYTPHPDSPSTKNKVLGASFLVVDKSGPIYAGAAGHTSLPITSCSTSSTPSFQTDSFLWVASLTKLLTTICLMQLVQQGKLSLDEDVRDRLPELTQAGILRGFDKEGEDGKAILEKIETPITPRQLLTHSVGLSYDFGHPLLTRWAKEVGKTSDTNSMTVEGWTTPLLFTPGEGWVYGTGLDWAAVLLERVLGGNTQTLGGYMKKNIFEPLGMETSTLKPAAEPVGKLEKKMKDKLAPVALRDAETGELSIGELPLPAAWDPEAESGGAGLWTTAEDYGKVLSAVLRASSGVSSDEDGGLGLKKETVDLMFTGQLNEKGLEMVKEMGRAFKVGIMPEFPDGFEAVDHGLGGLLNLEDVEGKRRKGSMMWHGYCNSHWWIDRETGIGACLLVEQFPFADPIVVDLYNDLERAVYGELVPEWKETKDI